MQTGLVIYGDLATISGGYLYDRKLVEYLRRCGDSVEEISLRQHSYIGCLTENLASDTIRRLASFSGDFLLQDELAHPSLFLINRQLKKQNRPQLVGIVHHLRSQEQRPKWQNRFYRFVECSYLNTLDGFIFNSRTTRQTVAQLGIELDRIPHCVALPAGDQLLPQLVPGEIERRATEPGPLRIVFVGNLIPRKGLHTLLDALSKIPEERCTLAVIGNQSVDPNYTRRILRQIAALGLQEVVQLFGALPDTELALKLRNSHVLVVPSTYEGYGIVYLEGMGYGLPAIATTSGAAVEIIRDGQNGFLVPAQDPATLAARLDELALDRIRLIEMGQAAIRSYSAHPTWVQTGAQIREFLISIIT